MMMIYVGILLLYRPYVTILTLGFSFLSFYCVLLTYQNGLSFQPKEVLIFGKTSSISSGDMVNYITFFVSLTTVCIAMYHGRLKEARRTSDLQVATIALERKQKEMHEQFIQTFKALADALDAKDPYTNGHSLRVADYSRAIAEAAGKTVEECENIYYAALLHDVGKIGIPKSILAKPGRLTDEEFEQIKQHTVMGSQILANMSMIPWLSIGARYHHERYNGRGYPEGLKGEAIPEIGRIIAVADAYDAMTSNRSYRNAIPQHIVREEIVKGIGTQFDPDFAKIMLHMIDLDTEYHMQETISGANLSPTASLRCETLYHDCTDGIAVTKMPVRIRLCSQPDDGYPENESLPTLIVFDSLDGKVHPGEENNKDLLYFEYARIRLDGQVETGGVRKAEVRFCDRETDLERSHFGEPERGQRYKVEAARYRDHAILRISDETRTYDVILALPDSSRFVYISLAGEHCYIHNVLVENDDKEIDADFIPRIAEEISFIKGCPEGDVPNVQVDGWRSDATTGIPIEDCMTISFHTMSLPTARLVWHCPFISVFSSDDAKVNGQNFREYMLLRLDGENWESDDHVENSVHVDQQPNFGGWAFWKDENKKGLDCTVSIRREKNVITMQTENLGIVIHTVTTILDDVKDVYAAITGDQCALTNIHVIREA
ncbi:MAG: HD-GYP domain-containing protein [Clostridia bacterium]|nr:HD-GYP domain-containing protein [Clostridia bacterium]